MNKCEESGFEHCWKEMPHTTMEYRPDGLYPRHRKCENCGKKQIMILRWDDASSELDE